MDEITRYNKCKVYNKFKSNRNFDDPKILERKILRYSERLKKIYEEDPEFKKLIPIFNHLESNKIYKSLMKNTQKYNSKLVQLRKQVLDESQKMISAQNINDTNILPAINNDVKNHKIIKVRMINLNKTFDLKRRRRKLIYSLSTKDIESKKIFKKKNIFLFNNTKDKSISPPDSRLNTESKKDSSFNFYNEKKRINFFILSNLNRSMDIIKKCELEVKKGISMDKYINNYKKISSNNKIVIPDIKTVEEQKIENQTNDLKKEIHEPIIPENVNNDIKIQSNNFRKINKNLKKKQAQDDKIIETAIKLVTINYERINSFKKRMNQINRKNKRIKLLRIKKELFKKSNIKEKINLLEVFHKDEKNKYQF